MSGSRIDTGPEPAWPGVPEDVRQMHRRAAAKASRLAKDADGDHRSVRREFSAWLNNLGEGELAHLPELRRERLVAVAQRALWVVLRARMASELGWTLREIAEAGIREVLALREAANRGCGPDPTREHPAEHEFVATITALLETTKELLDLSRVLIICRDFSQYRDLLVEYGPGFLDRLPTDLGGALRDGDWTTLVPLALAFADDLRARVQIEHAELLAFAEGGDDGTLAFFEELLEDADRRENQDPSGPGGGWL